MKQNIGKLTLTVILTISALVQVRCVGTNKAIGRYAEAICSNSDTATFNRDCRTVDSETSRAEAYIASVPSESVAPLAATTSTGPVAPSTAATIPPAVPAQSSRPSNIASLPDRSLASLINVLSKLDKQKRKDILSELSLDIKSPPKESSFVDRTIYQRTIFINVSKVDAFNPSDRLARTELFIAPTYDRYAKIDDENCVLRRNNPNDNKKIEKLEEAGVDWNVASWDLAATIYTTVTPGSIVVTQEAKVSADASITSPAPTTGGLGQTLGLSGSQTVGRNENATISSSIDNLSAMYWPNQNEFVIRRQGGYGIDLTGNTILKINLRLAQSDDTTISYRFKYQDLFDENLLAIQPSKLSLDFQRIKIPGKKYAIVSKGNMDTRNVAGGNADTTYRDVLGYLFLHYVLRHISAGDESYEEADDYVRFVSKEASCKPVVMIPGNEMGTTGFGIVVNGVEFLSIKHDYLPSRRRLCFDTYDEAQRFLSYLQKMQFGGVMKIKSGEIFSLYGGIGNLRMSLPVSGCYLDDSLKESERIFL